MLCLHQSPTIRRYRGGEELYRSHSADCPVESPCILVEDLLQIGQ